MIELSKPEFTTALPLLREIEQKVLPYAICQGINPGRVFVDRRQEPAIAMLWSPVGYFFLAGNPEQARDLTEISKILTEVFVPASRAGGESSFILITHPKSWQAHLPALLPGRELIEIYRRPFAFAPAQFAALGRWRERIPQGFSLQPVDAALAAQVGALASWTSEEDFTTHGLGFVLLDGEGAVASACISVFASQQRVEIDVHTSPQFQRRGFATITAAAFIEACLQRGKQPNWECFWENDVSTALAVKLGFSALPDYPVAYWEE